LKAWDAEGRRTRGPRSLLFSRNCSLWSLALRVGNCSLQLKTTVGNRADCPNFDCCNPQPEQSGPNTWVQRATPPLSACLLPSRWSRVGREPKKGIFIPPLFPAKRVATGTQVSCSRRTLNYFNTSPPISGRCVLQSSPLTSSATRHLETGLKNRRVCLLRPSSPLAAR